MSWIAHHTRNRRSRRPLPLVPLATVLALPALALSLWPTTPGDASARPRAAHPTQSRDAAASSFIASVDTMKESRDTEMRPLSDAQIAADVNVAASLNTTYITVDTHWDYPAYMLRWADAVRAAGRHVWFRIHPNQWGNNNGTTGIMTPAQYEDSEQAFILANPAIFRPGDILDPCPEPENGLYWRATYDDGWTAGAPNAATEEYNRFIRDTTDVADAALRQDGIDGVITTVRSTNSFFASHPGALEAATVARMGRVTVDSYPEGTTTDPQTATQARIDELNTIEQAWGVPVVIGEMGYSNKVVVDDATQEAVLKAEFGALASLPYLAGANYWVGAGTDDSGGYTHIFAGSTGNWTPRPAAAALAALYQLRTSTDPRATASATPFPSATSLTFGGPGPASPTTSATVSTTSTPMTTATSLATPTNTAASAPTATDAPTDTPTTTTTTTTSTGTPTSTATSTSTPIRTSTSTATSTSTGTPIRTSTATSTSTGTPTSTATSTGTPTSTGTSPATLPPPDPTPVVATVTATMPVALPSPSSTPTLLPPSPSALGTAIAIPSATGTGTAGAATTIAPTPAVSHTPQPRASATVATTAPPVEATAMTAATFPPTFDPTSTASSTSPVTSPASATATPFASATSAASAPQPMMSPTTAPQPTNPAASSTVAATVVSAPTASATPVAPTSTPLPTYGRPPVHCRHEHGRRRCAPPHPHPHLHAHPGHPKTPVAWQRHAVARGVRPHAAP